MPGAYVLINVESGTEDRVLKAIKNIVDPDGIVAVEESYISYGVYDLIVKIRSESMEELKEIVSYKIRQISNVRSTLTLMLVEE